MKGVQEVAEERKRLIEEIKSGQDMVLIPAGEFMMGSDKSESDEQDEKPRHVVRLNAFTMDKYLVTQEMFEAVMWSNPSQFKGPKLPVENVTWDEARKFCEKVGKRLPTEAEWEYAARAGTTAKYYWGGGKMDGAYAWANNYNSENKTHPVGQKKPNA